MRIKFVFLGVFLLTSQVGFAITVVDPSNLVQNTYSAIKAGQNQLSTALMAKKAITDEINQYQQLKNLIQSNAKSLSHLNIKNPNDTLQRLNNAIEAAEYLKFKVGTSKTLGANIQAMYGAGNYKSWDEFAQILKKRYEAGDATAKNLMTTAETAQAQVIAANKAHNEVIKNISDVKGATEAAQVTASAVSVLIDQNNAILKLADAQAKHEAIKTGMAQAADQERNKSSMDYADKKAAELETLNKFYAK